MFQLGHSSFWYDETGVAAVVYSQSLNSFISLVRSHVMAVPLDYAVTWLVGQQCNTETCLRIPSALWGTLSLLIGHLLCRALFNPRVAMQATFLMALSPFLIQYSQELRFYSSLIFFYLLSSYLLFQALKSDYTKTWLLAVLSLVIGIFFHIFTAFALVNGWVWFLFKRKENCRNRQCLIRKMLLVSLTVVLTIFVAYITFLGYTPASLSHQLLDFEPSLLRLFGIAFGWLPYFGRNLSLSWLWGLTCFVLEVIGIVVLVARHPKSPAAGFLYSVILQIGMILCVNFAKQYAVTPRQFIALLPFGLMLVAFGSAKVHDWFSNHLKPTRSQESRPFKISWLFLAIFCFTSLPALKTYYNMPKSYAREIAEYLAANWQDEEDIFFTSTLNAYPIHYYLIERMGRNEIDPHFHMVSDQDLSPILTWRNRAYIISPNAFDEIRMIQLTSAGFEQITTQNNWGDTTICVRDPVEQQLKE